MEGQIRTVALGVQDVSHLTDIVQTLNDCVDAGHWLVMENVHLAQDLWTGELLHALQV